MTLLYLFDIDGTLLSAHGSGRDAFDAVFHQHHGIASASEGIRYGGKTDPGIIDEIYRARLGRDATAEEHAAFLAGYLPRLVGPCAGAWGMARGRSVRAGPGTWGGGAAGFGSSSGGPKRGASGSVNGVHGITQ